MPGFSYSAIYTAKIFICILAQANMIYLVTPGYLFAISIIEMNLPSKSPYENAKIIFIII